MKNKKVIQKQDDQQIRKFSDISNVSGGITDEEFADEFLAYPASPGTDSAQFQFNFLGADLEKINSAKNVDRRLSKK